MTRARVTSSPHDPSQAKGIHPGSGSPLVGSTKTRQCFGDGAWYVGTVDLHGDSIWLIRMLRALLQVLDCVYRYAHADSRWLTSATLSSPVSLVPSPRGARWIRRPL